MQPLIDSGEAAADPGLLRHRLAADGYLFLRGLLPEADVRAAHDGVVAALHRGGWIDAAGRPAGKQRALTVKDALGDPAFRASLITPGLNRLPYLAPLRNLVRSVLGATAFSYPVKVLRTVYPERLPAVTLGRYVHQDYQNSGVQDMLTTWLPLMEIPAALGGLAVLPGSHLGPPARPRLLRADEPGWASADFMPGDVLLFHCMTAHAARPNRADLVRLSTDCRWQRSDQPAPAEMILRPADPLGQPAGQLELFSRLFGHQPWWQRVPAGLDLRSRAALTAASAPPAPSRFFALHPGWQRWRPPGGPLR